MLLSACRFFGALPSQIEQEDMTVFRLMDLHSLLEPPRGE